jgi:hypothetical protein
LRKAWAAAPYSDETVLFMNADDLARKFRRCIQEQRDLIDWGINREWVEESFPLFCRSLGGKLDKRTHYGVFANRLAKVMERGRRDVWHGGIRNGTITVYWVPDPAAAVVDLGCGEARAGVKGEPGRKVHPLSLPTKRPIERMEQRRTLRCSFTVLTVARPCGGRPA